MSPYKRGSRTPLKLHLSEDERLWEKSILVSRQVSVGPGGEEPAGVQEREERDRGRAGMGQSMMARTSASVLRPRGSLRIVI